MFEPTPAIDDAPDPSVARAERRLVVLQEITEIGMELLRALKSREPASDKGRDPAEVFAPLSRAIRLTLALEARTDEELRDLKAGVVRTREIRRVAAREDADAAQEACLVRVEDLVANAADAECETVKDFENLCEALEERLTEDEAYMDVARRPLRETVERLCKDLGLSPDWSLWDGEGWIHEGLPWRPRLSPFNTPSAKPLRGPNGMKRKVPPPPPPRRHGGGHELE